MIKNLPDGNCWDFNVFHFEKSNREICTSRDIPIVWFWN